MVVCLERNMKVPAYFLLLTFTAAVFIWKTVADGEFFAVATAGLLIVVGVFRGFLLRESLSGAYNEGSELARSVQSIRNLVSYFEVALGATLVTFLLGFLVNGSMAGGGQAIGHGAALLILPAGVVAAFAAFRLRA
ncbi:hypothetical protein CCYS_01730 [Corynebacterium cystitidis DSM 20524]|uniref:Uncharacterized protein n=2 Tax=Corynebacterium cystitidis TaxID=35757 RepID=A0A1H9VYU6_9CORY|nr:hypothetical protein CCYS_01730 [Corynebacterium cystitidis DSM 20524]SES26689.1 hypothetical protein SAMN05661109_02447 [Corynebacterium cystitidis DSM 20524]SNV88414.1 Uncharacterised protein [Corynebacterium cystitidis]